MFEGEREWELNLDWEIRRMDGWRLGWREVCNLRFHGGGSDERVKVAGPMQGSTQLLFIGCVTLRLFILHARSRNIPGNR